MNSAKCSSRKGKHIVVIDYPSQIKVLVIHVRMASADAVHETLQRLSRSWKCYLIGNAGLAGNIESVPWNFQLPNAAFLASLLKRESVRLDEIAYISDSMDFLNNARGLMGYTIFIKPKGPLLYDRTAGFCPDAVCSGIDRILPLLSPARTSFKGEAAINDGSIDAPGKLSVFLYRNGEHHFRICFAGRYFNSRHYMNTVDKYSHAIVRNKNENSRLYGRFNNIFIQLYSVMIRSYQKHFNMRIDALANVPDKPAKKPRSKQIVSGICDILPLEDISASFVCRSSMQDSKSLMTSRDRAANTLDSYTYSGPPLTGRTIALIDDIATTGSTLAACVDELLAHGAEEVICFVLAINQFACDFCIRDALEGFQKDNQLHFNATTLIPFFTRKQDTVDYDTAIAEVLDIANRSILDSADMEDESGYSL